MSIALPDMLKFANEIDTAEIKNHFPAELEINIKDGIATSNIEGPAYFGKIPADETAMYEEKGHAVLLDTTNDYTLAELRQVDAYFVMTKDAFLGEDDGEVRLYYYADIFQDNEFTLNQEVIGEWLEVLKGFAKPIVYVLYAMAIGFITTFFSIGWFILAFFFSLVTMLIASIQKKEMRYAHAYKTTLYGLVPVMVIAIFAPGLPVLVKLLMFVIILLVNLKD